LWRRLCQQKIPALLTQEPGGSTLGNKIRKALKKGQSPPFSPQAELLLFTAARAQLISEVISPALEEGKVVICDRFSNSTVAYQGHGRGLSLDMIEAINSLATGNLTPDLIILLDLPPEEGLKRKRILKDPFELENLSFHRRVREGYLRTAAIEPERWLIIDAALPRRQVSEIIWEEVSQLLQALS
ncbi:MAG: dTMP kinase, partial [Chloroflexota bacterium]|nr:dTMP kinase [Chloroflexota bacterium]